MPKLKEFKREIDVKIEENKKSKQLELDSKEMKGSKRKFQTDLKKFDSNIFISVDVPIDVVNKHTKILTAFKQVQIIAEHYNIYNNLFGSQYFRPVVDLNVKYPSNNVFYGNKINAKDVLYSFKKY